MMTRIIKKSGIALLLLAAGSFVLSSCYDKYDPSSYAPEFSIGGYTSASEIASDALVGYWPFNGNLTDSVSGTTGENTGTTFTNGFLGQALQGAMNSYVLTDPSSTITSMKSFTISFWVNTPPPSTGIIGLFSLSNTANFWGNVEMFFENGSDNSNGKLRTHVFNGTADKTFASDGVLNLFDKWVQITVTYDGATSTYNLYVNGSTVSTITMDGTGNLMVTNPGKIVFGTVQFMTDPSQTSATDMQPWASYLTGAIDEVRIYNKALSPDDVNALVVLQGKGK